MQKIYWWPIAKHLAEYLPSQKDKQDDLIFDGIDIYAGTKENYKKYPCVEIKLDRESNSTITGSQGKIAIWIDIISKNNSSNPAEAYELLYKWQTAVINLLRQWQKDVAKELGIALKAEIGSILSDGDMQRPICASRMMLAIEWRNSV